MHTTSLTLDQLADVLADAPVFDRHDGPGSCDTYLLQHAGRDKLIVYDTMTGAALMVDAPDPGSQSSADVARALLARLGRP